MFPVSRLRALSASLLALSLGACSIDVSAPVTPTAVRTATPTLAPSDTPEPDVPTPSVTDTPAPPTATPLPWAALDLSGRLIFTRGNAGIAQLDLTSGELTSIYQPAAEVLVKGAAVSPDGQVIVMAYAPAPAPGQPQVGFTDLYTLPADGSAPPEPLLMRAMPQELYTTPLWSPDGQYIYFGHFATVIGAGGISFKYTIERMAYPGGAPEALVDNAFWPQLSPDGTQLAYVVVDQAKNTNELYVADADGQNPRLLLESSVFTAIDSPLFAPDGQHLIISAVGDGPAPTSTWLDWLLGAKVASAHDVPSDFWSVALEDGTLTRLTRIQDIGLYGSFAPDGQHVAFLTLNGVFAMSPDGDDLTTLLSLGAAGTLNWVP